MMQRVWSMPKYTNRGLNPAGAKIVSPEAGGVTRDSRGQVYKRLSSGQIIKVK